MSRPKKFSRAKRQPHLTDPPGETDGRADMSGKNVNLENSQVAWYEGRLPALLVGLAGALLAVCAGYYASRGPGWLDVPLDRWKEILVIGAGAGALGLWAVFKRPEAGLLMLIALFYTNASEVGVRHYGLPSLLQLLSLGTAAGVAVRLVGLNGRPGRRLIVDPLLVPLLLYGAVMFVSSLGALNLGLADERLSDLLKGLLIFVVVTNLTTSKLTLKRVVWALVASGAILATISVYQVLTGAYDQDFGGFGRTKVALIVGESREPRIAGSLSDPNFYAQILVMLVPLALYRLWDEPSFGRKLLAGYALAVTTLAAIFTYSRGGAIALALVLLLAVLHKRVSVKYFLLGLLALAPLVLFVPEGFQGRVGTLTELAPNSEDGSAGTEGEDSSFRHRKMLMAAAQEMFADHPMMGVGPGNYTEHFDEYSGQVGMTMRSFDNFGQQQFPHNLYLEVAAETGIVGLLAFFAIIAGTALSLRLAYRSFRDAGETGSANVVASLALSAVAFLTTSLFLHGTYIRYFWLSCAISAAARQIGRTTEPR